jgi:hypothetical protein
MGAWCCQVGLQADTGVLPRADGGPANLPTKKIQADLVERQLSRADGGSLSMRNPKFARTSGQHPWPRCLLLRIFAAALPLTPRTERFDNKSRRLRLKQRRLAFGLQQLGRGSHRPRAGNLLLFIQPLIFFKVHKLSQAFFDLSINKRPNLNFALYDVRAKRALGQALLDILAFNYL